jgi:hypothetical protein
MFGAARTRYESIFIFTLSGSQLFPYFSNPAQSFFTLAELSSTIKYSAGFAGKSSHNQ